MRRSARSLIACPREVGAECPYCAAEIVLGDPIMVCQACGTVHHRSCWRVHGRCGAYSCAPAAATAPERETFRAGPDDHPRRSRPRGAVPAAARRAWRMPEPAPAHSSAGPPAIRRVNRLAIASFDLRTRGHPALRHHHGTGGGLAGASSPWARSGRPHSAGSAWQWPACCWASSTWWAGSSIVWVLHAWPRAARRPALSPNCPPIGGDPGARSPAPARDAGQRR